MSRSARVRIHTDEFVIEGLLHLGAKAGGYKGRVSDILNEESGFLVLTDVSMYEVDSDEDRVEPMRHDTLVLRKGEIKFLIPFD